MKRQSEKFHPEILAAVAHEARRRLRELLDNPERLRGWLRSFFEQEPSPMLAWACLGGLVDSGRDDVAIRDYDPQSYSRAECALLVDPDPYNMLHGGRWVLASTRNILREAKPLILKAFADCLLDYFEDVEVGAKNRN